MSDGLRSRLSAAAVCVAVIAAPGSLAACSKKESDTAKDTQSQSQTSEQPKKPTTGTAGKLPTISDYIKQNNISETPVQVGDPTAPKVTIPAVLGWQDAGESTPPDAFAAMVNTDPNLGEDPPSVVILMSRLGNNADPAEILNLAPNELANLPQFDNGGSDPENVKLAGFDAVRAGGTYLRDGATRLIAQETVVIPGKDGLYVMQLNADGSGGQVQALGVALDAIDKGATIEP